MKGVSQESRLMPALQDPKRKTRPTQSVSPYTEGVILSKQSTNASFVGRRPKRKPESKSER